MPVEASLACKGHSYALQPRLYKKLQKTRNCNTEKRTSTRSASFGSFFSCDFAQLVSLVDSAKYLFEAGLSLLID